MSSQPSLLLPAKHRDKLKLVVVLCGYSAIACGHGMKGIEQQKKLHEFYYGKPPDKVSNVEMLVKGLSSYADLYEEVVYQEFQEDGKKVDLDGLQLKPELMIDFSMPYYAGVHILASDLKSMNRSGKITYAAPKTLLNWAKSGAQEFRRADAFCARW